MLFVEVGDAAGWGVAADSGVGSVRESVAMCPDTCVGGWGGRENACCRQRFGIRAWCGNHRPACRREQGWRGAVR